jgi:hypothetical protein
MYEYTSKFGKQTVGTLFRKGRNYFKKVLTNTLGFDNINLALRKYRK